MQQIVLIFSKTYFSYGNITSTICCRNLLILLSHYVSATVYDKIRDIRKLWKYLTLRIICLKFFIFLIKIIIEPIPFYTLYTIWGTYLSQFSFMDCFNLSAAQESRRGMKVHSSSSNWLNFPETGLNYDIYPRYNPKASFTQLVWQKIFTPLMFET